MNGIRAYIDSNGRVIDEKEFYDKFIKQVEDDNCKFNHELEKLMSLGFSELQSGCYLANYHDDYICDTYNGGCKDIGVCIKIKELYK